MNEITHFFFGLYKPVRTGRWKNTSNFTMEVPTEANNAESKVKKFPVALFITTSSRRPASRSVTVSVEGHSL